MQAVIEPKKNNTFGHIADFKTQVIPDTPSPYDK